MENEWCPPCSGRAVGGQCSRVTKGNDKCNKYEMSQVYQFYGFTYYSMDDVDKSIRVLSGGERGRLQLACTLKQGANVLLLDEPSNDLDVETLRALEEALLTYPGCAMIISHDRWFLERICTHILAYEGDSQVTFFDGNYTEYEEDRKARLGGDAAPKRVKYKKLK